MERFKSMTNHTNHMEIEISKMGERGQIVIPLEFREDLRLKKGEKFLVVKEDSKIILEPMKALKAKTLNELKEDLIDIKIANKFWEDVKKGKTIKQTKKEFLKDLEKW